MSEPARAADDRLTLGQRIRELRKRKNITLQQLASAIERSVGFVSQIERGLSQPSVADLYVISDVLGVHGTYFFTGAAAPDTSPVVRAQQRRTFHYARGVTDFLASPSLGGRFFMLETVLEPGADTGERNLVDQAEQGGYVLAGELTLWLGDEPTVLQPGDSFQFDSGRPCRYGNRGDVATRVLWIFG